MNSRPHRHLANSALNARISRSTGAKRMEYIAEREARDTNPSDESSRRLTPAPSITLTPEQRKAIIFELASSGLAGESGAGRVERLCVKFGIKFPGEQQMAELRKAATVVRAELRGEFRRGAGEVAQGW
jgi:hypothetical protein